MTIYLTLYYHIILKKLDLTENMKNYIIHNNILRILFNKDTLNVFNYNVEMFFNKIDDKMKIIKYIINNIYLTNTQLNVSFIDILAIDNIYKIGYSGTLNINFPKIDKYYDKYDDYDEIINVSYAILNDETKIITDIKFIDDYDYDAYIDVCGKYKNEKNEIIAKQFYELKKRPVIFIDEFDNIKVIFDSKIEIYNDNDFESLIPIFYYDQSHIIGIDIKQEKYPKLKGLCIVDKRTKYKEIAQSIFRLRKINIGHTIDIYIDSLDKSIDNIYIYNMFIDNDKLDKKSKESLLNFQTYKALIRKKHTDKTIHSNQEIAKYYINITDNNLLQQIYSTSEINNSLIIQNLLSDIIVYDNDLLTKLNLNSTKLLSNLIYNIDIDIISTQTELEQERDTEQERVKEHDTTSYIDAISIIEKEIFFRKTVIKYDNTDTIITDLHYPYIENVISSDIYYLPNIFTFKLTGMLLVA